MENETELLELENPEEGQDSILDETVDYSGETVDEREERLKKAEEIARNQRMRAERAERELKALKSQKTEKQEKASDLSLKDIRALSDVPDADVDEVLDFAKFKNISVAEAKNNPVMQTLLRTRAEERASAQAVTTAGNKRGVSKVSDDVYLSKVQNGEDMSEDEMRQAALAQIRKWKQN